jgi:ribonuclease T2
VHGVWPTQFHRIAPGFCNNSWPFDAASVGGIQTEMAANWPDVEMRNVPDSMWAHEWAKHGTCAVGQVDGVSSQQDYFRTGCRLGRESPVTGWLATAGVTPSDERRYTMKTVWDAVVMGAGTRPHIDCQKIDGQVYIKEVKVCYSKQLERVDCDGIKSAGEGELGMLGTCLRWPEFLYPASSAPPGRLLRSSDPAGLAGLLAGLIAVSIVIGLALAFFFYKRRNRTSGYESL